MIILSKKISLQSYSLLQRRNHSDQIIIDSITPFVGSSNQDKLLSCTIALVIIIATKCILW